VGCVFTFMEWFECRLVEGNANVVSYAVELARKVVETDKVCTE